MGVKELISGKTGAIMKGTKSVRAPALTIDYPQDGEIVLPGHYAVRLSGPALGAEVEVSINGEEWQCCRNGAGFYWYDWWAEPGDAKIIGRFRLMGGEWKKSKERRLNISEPEKN